jgi:hypothetical protein
VCVGRGGFELDGAPQPGLGGQRSWVSSWCFVTDWSTEAVARLHAVGGARAFVGRFSGLDPRPLPPSPSPPPRQAVAGRGLELRGLAGAALCGLDAAQ